MNLNPQDTTPLPFALYTTSTTPAGIKHSGKMKNPTLRDFIKSSVRDNTDAQRRLCDVVNHVKSAELKGMTKKKELQGIGASSGEEAMFLILLKFLRLDDDAVKK